MTAPDLPARQRGRFVVGFIVGLLLGLTVALAVALYITKAPIPFVNKVPQRTAEQDSAEAARNRSWDPNAPLSGKGAARAASGAVPAGASAPVADAASAAVKVRDASPPAAAGGASAAAARSPADSYDFYVQAGAFTRNEDAEQQRARLALLGVTARVTEREQAGRTVYRVRAGPYPVREEADALQGKLQEQGVEAQIVRVERP